MPFCCRHFAQLKPCESEDPDVFEHEKTAREISCILFSPVDMQLLGKGRSVWELREQYLPYYRDESSPTLARAITMNFDSFTYMKARLTGRWQEQASSTTNAVMTPPLIVDWHTSLTG